MRFELPDRLLDDSVLVVDNYDSFTFNLVQYIGDLGAKCVVIRHDSATVAAVASRRPAALVISPGPGVPDDAGISMELIRTLGVTVPTLGVCLGHQAIGAVYGGRVVRSPQVMHGKVSTVRHHGVGLYNGIGNPFSATRYHSLIVDREGLPDCLEITAWTEDGTVMGLRHREFPIYGMQFHPESLCTEAGMRLLAGFLDGGGVPLSRVAQT